MNTSREELDIYSELIQHKRRKMEERMSKSISTVEASIVEVDAAAKAKYGSDYVFIDDTIFTVLLRSLMCTFNLSAKEVICILKKEIK